MSKNYIVKFAKGPEQICVHQTAQGCAKYEKGPEVVARLCQAKDGQEYCENIRDAVVPQLKHLDEIVRTSLRAASLLAPDAPTIGRRDTGKPSSCLREEYHFAFGGGFTKSCVEYAPTPAELCVQIDPGLLCMPIRSIDVLHALDKAALEILFDIHPELATGSHKGK